MRTMRCPRCATTVQVPDGAKPVCSTCGFGGAAPAPATPAYASAPQAPARYAAAPYPPPPGTPGAAFGAPPKKRMGTGVIIAIVVGVVAIVAAIAVVGAAVVFVLVSNAAGPDCDTGEGHSEGSYTMCGPDGWEKSSFPPADVVFLSPDDGDGFRENINVVQDRLPAGTTLEEYYDASLEGLEDYVTDYSFIGEGRRTVDGTPGHWIEFQGRQGQYTLHFWQFLTVSDGSGIIFTYTAQAEDHSRDKAAAMSALDSMSFR